MELYLYAPICLHGLHSVNSTFYLYLEWHCTCRHCWLRHQMQASGHLDAPADLPPLKGPTDGLDTLAKTQNSVLAGNRTARRQPIYCSHCSHWATVRPRLLPQNLTQNPTDLFWWRRADRRPYCSSRVRPPAASAGGHVTSCHLWRSLLESNHFEDQDKNGG